jgi:hypothetical protein
VLSLSGGECPQLSGSPGFLFIPPVADAAHTISNTDSTARESALICLRLKSSYGSRHSGMESVGPFGASVFPVGS